MKYNKILLLITSILILTPIIIGGIMWNELPEQMATHWDMAGNANDWTSRAFAVFGLPMIVLLIHWLCIIFTAADRKNKDQNRKALNMVLWICPALSLYANAIMYATAFGLEINTLSLVFGFLGILFIIIGNYMPKTKQNHTIGIKISHTLESEENWNKTHRMAGRLWVIAGIIMLICIFIPFAVSQFIVIAVLAVSVIAPIVYSYVYHRKEIKKGKIFMRNKKLKKRYIIGLVIPVVIVAAIMFVMFSGDISIAYYEDHLVIDSMYCDALTVKFSEIGSVEYHPEYVTGEKISGFNSAKLILGKYKNDTLGEYQRFTYTGNNGYMVIELIDGPDTTGYIVLGGKSLNATNEIFDELTEKIVE